MANVVRLVNGGTIQVRTGVLAGVGPAGPRGLIGPVGPDGPQGPIGETGPQGAIIQIQARANISSTTTLSAATEANISFGTVVYDDMSVFTSSTNFTLPEDGDYLLSAYVRFSAGASNSGIRRLKWSSSLGGDLWITSQEPSGTQDCYVEISCPYRGVSGEVLNLKGYQNDDESINISAGAVTITRVGSGPQGAQGPTGPAGATGATGPQGPTGPTGSAGAGYATYGDILP